MSTPTPHQRPDILPAIPSALSSENRPGPVAASATATVQMARLYSKPPSVNKKPLGKWTEPTATTITQATASAANGVTKPSTRSRPAHSDAPATSAIASGG